MLFSSITFIFVFLPLTLFFYYIVPFKFKNHILLAASIIFYFSGEAKYTVLLIFSAMMNWAAALLISAQKTRKKAKAVLILVITANLLLLAFYKYSDFFINNINYVFSTDIPLPGISLPIGISFYTFQAMSYTIDVYRKDSSAQKSLLTFSTYLCLFPQLVAGPIVRYNDIENELSSRVHTLDLASDGVRRFVIGLLKKVIISNNLGLLCETFRNSNDKSVLFSWIYAISFTLQIYFDFSGYSDMAIGLGKMFGFTFPENFNYPYISRSITEFWRRWHITLSSWFKSYVYIPLGGNRVRKPRLALNILIVWMLTGLWHGSMWTFVLWGLLYALLLLAERMTGIGKKKTWWGHIYTMFFVIMGFVLFNAGSLSQAYGDIKMMFGATAVPFCNIPTLYYLSSYATLIIISCIFATPLVNAVVGKLNKKSSWRRFSAFAEPIFTVIVLCVVTGSLLGSSFNPFLYFRF